MNKYSLVFYGNYNSKYSTNKNGIKLQLKYYVLYSN